MLKAAPAAAICLATLAACKSEIALTLFTSDVASVADTGKSLDATATLSLEASTEEKCTEVKDQLAQALQVGFSKVEFVACRKADFDTWADFRVAVPILQPQTKSDSALMIWAGNTGLTQSGGGIAATLRQNPDSVKAVIAALPNDMKSLVTGRIDTRVSLILQNDMTDAVIVTAQGAFIDGEPYQLPKDTTLERRSEVKITLSDVGNAAMHNGGGLLFFLKKP